MKTIYQLKRDQELLSEFLLSKEIVFFADHGMIGTSLWWENLRTGELPLFTFKGDILSVNRNFQAISAWVDVTAKSISGESFEFHRQGKMDELVYYREGSGIEVDYVKQNCRHKRVMSTPMTKIIPIEIRVNG